MPAWKYKDRGWIPCPRPSKLRNASVTIKWMLERINLNHQPVGDSKGANPTMLAPAEVGEIVVQPNQKVLPQAAIVLHLIIMIGGGSPPQDVVIAADRIGTMNAHRHR